MKRALVTGGSGFLGRHLVEELLRQKVQTTVLTRQPRPDRRYVAMGDTPWDEARLANVIRNARPDVIFHLVGSAVGSDSQLRALNLHTGQSIMRAVRVAEVLPKLVFCGSAAEYGAAIVDGVPVAENAECRPLSPYGRTKFAQTQAALAFAHETGASVLVARIFNPIGPGMPRYLAIGDFAQQIAASSGPVGSLETGSLDTCRDFLDVRPAISAMISLAKNPAASGVVNVCSGRAVSLRSLVEVLIQVSGRQITIHMSGDRLRTQDFAVVVGSVERLTGLGALPPATDFKDVIQEIWVEALQSFNRKLLR